MRHVTLIKDATRAWTRHHLNVNFGNYQFTVDRRRVKVLEDAGVGLVVDIGANAGQYATQIRANGYTARILSLEPAAEPYALLASAAEADPLWDHRRVGVGDTSGTLELNISASSLFNSALPVIEAEISTVPEARVVGTERVPVERLDALLDGMEHDGALAVKADVQGFERSVLLGAVETLQRAVVVELELSPRAIYGGDQMLMLEALHRMDDAGFVPVLAENLLLEPISGRSRQFNYVFARPQDV